jgi:glucose 1-dehydrogenase
MRLKEKVAIITGAATGIGQGIAERFAKEGAAVVVDYVGKPDAPNKTEEAIRAAGGRTIAVEADVSNPEQVQNLIQSAVREYGRLDIIINNAGIERKYAFVDYPLDEARKILDVNLLGPFLVSQAAAKQMIQQGDGGRIINHLFSFSARRFTNAYKRGVLRFQSGVADAGAHDCCGISKIQHYGEQHRPWSHLHSDRCGY